MLQKRVLGEPSNPFLPTMHAAVSRVCMRVAASVHDMRDAPACHHVSAVHTMKMLIELACPLQGCLALAEALMNVMPHLVMDESGCHVRDTGLQCIQVLVDLQVRHPYVILHISSYYCPRVITTLADLKLRGQGRMYRRDIASLPGATHATEETLLLYRSSTKHWAA